MTIKEKIIYGSLALLLIPFALGVADYLTAAPDNHRGMGYGLIMAIAIIAEVGLLILVALLLMLQGWWRGAKEHIAPGKGPGNRQKALYCLSAAGLVLVIGGSLCFGGGIALETFSQ